MSEHWAPASNLGGVTVCQPDGVEWRRGPRVLSDCCFPLTLLLSLIPWPLLPKPWALSLFLGSGCWVSVLLSVLCCYHLHWEGHFKPHWVAESWIWDQGQAGTVGLSA